MPLAILGGVGPQDATNLPHSVPGTARCLHDAAGRRHRQHPCRPQDMVVHVLHAQSPPLLKPPEAIPAGWRDCWAAFRVSAGMHPAGAALIAPVPLVPEGKSWP